MTGVGTNRFGGVTQGPNSNRGALQDASLVMGSGSQVIVPEGIASNYLLVSNPNSFTVWLNPTGGVAAPSGLGCIALTSGGSSSDHFEWANTFVPTNAMTAVGNSGAPLTVIYA